MTRCGEAPRGGSTQTLLAHTHFLFFRAKYSECVCGAATAFAPSLPSAKTHRLGQCGAAPKRDRFVVMDMKNTNTVHLSNFSGKPFLPIASLLLLSLPCLFYM